MKPTWYGATGLLLGSGLGAIAVGGPLAPPLLLPTGHAPDAVYSHDLNGDGLWDLAWINRGDNTVSVALNGGGRFLPRVDYPTGAAPAALAVGDFDVDGDDDLAVANHDDDSLSVLLNDGSGAFAAKVDHPAGRAPVALASGADLDQDGINDLVVSNEGGASFSVLAGRGDGGFGTRTDHPAGGKPGAIALTYLGSADLIPDVVLLRPDDGKAAVFLGREGGGFHDAAEYAVGTAPASLFAGMVDDDFNFDLLVANAGDGSVSVLKGRDDAGFAPRVDHAVGAGPVFIPQPDWDGDGQALDLNLGRDAAFAPVNVDILTANRDGNSLTVLTNLGTGGYDAAHRADYPVGNRPGSVAVGDFDGDGAPDLAVANRADNTLSLLKGDGQHGFAAWPATLAIEPLALDFGDGEVGAATLRSLTVGNFGDGGLRLADIAIQPAGQFTQTNDCPASLAVGSSCVFQVAFTPRIAGPITAALSFVGGADQTPYTVPLSGNGTLAEARLDPQTLAFGHAGLGAGAGRTLTLANTGTAPLRLGAVAIEPADAYAQANDCPAALAPGGSCRFRIDFSPPANGAYDAQLSIAASDSATPHRVALSGVGTLADADLELRASAAPAAASVGGLVKYGFEIVNHGPNPARSVVLAYLPPPGTNWVRASVPCTRDGERWICGLGALKTDAKASLELWVQPTVAGSQAGGAWAYSALPDRNGANNQAGLALEVAEATHGQADLALKLGGGRRGLAGRPVEYRFAIYNRGARTAGEPTLIAALPDGAEFLGASGAGGCGLEKATLVCRPAPIKGGARRKFKLVLRYATANRYGFTAQVFSTQGDPALGNNGARADTQVR